MPSSFKKRTWRWISTSHTSCAGCGSSCSSPAPHAGYSFEQTLDLFLADVGGRVGTKPWQIQQASDAIRIYRYQYRGAKAGDGDGPTGARQISGTDIREIQELLGHRSVETTMIYTHVVRELKTKARSPLDCLPLRAQVGVT